MKLSSDSISVFDSSFESLFGVRESFLATLVRRSNVNFPDVSFFGLHVDMPDVLVAARVVLACAFVHGVLTNSAQAQILFAVVALVSIYVIHVLVRFDLHLVVEHVHDSMNSMLNRSECYDHVSSSMLAPSHITTVHNSVRAVSFPTQQSSVRVPILVDLVETVRLCCFSHSHLQTQYNH